MASNPIYITDPKTFYELKCLYGSGSPNGVVRGYTGLLYMQTDVYPFVLWQAINLTTVQSGTTTGWTKVARYDSGTTAQRPLLATAHAGYPYFDSTLMRLVVWNGTAWQDVIPAATTTTQGAVLKSAALTNAAPANAAGANPTAAEFNAVVAYVNELVAKLKAAGIQS